MKCHRVLLLLSCIIICEAAAAAARRSTRSSVAREPCPQSLALRDDCEKYAGERVIRQNVCAKYAVTDDLMITWSHCGSRVCYGPAGEYAAKNEDLSKPYPECCPKCNH